MAYDILDFIIEVVAVLLLIGAIIAVLIGLPISAIALTFTALVFLILIYVLNSLGSLF